jgi:hypothetical protein
MAVIMVWVLSSAPCLELFSAAPTMRNQWWCERVWVTLWWYKRGRKREKYESQWMLSFWGSRVAALETIRRINHYADIQNNLSSWVLLASQLAPLIPSSLSSNTGIKKEFYKHLAWIFKRKFQTKQ